MLADSHRRHTFSNSLQNPPARIDLTNILAVPNGDLPAANPRSPITPSRQLPIYIKPLPAKIGPDEVIYLSNKGALTIPPKPLRDALLQGYIEFIHPFMPTVDIPELLQSIDRSDGTNQVSLLVFQAIMFSGVASVDKKYLEAAGYATRREARREFFQKTRV